MIDLWNQLRQYIKVQLAPATSQSKESASLLRLRFTVTNTSPSPSPGFPEIVFKDVVLSIKASPSSSIPSRNLGTLAPGGSVEYECELSYTEAVEMTYELEATVSSEAFLHLRASGSPRDDVMQLPITAYIQMFNETQTHGWLNTVIKPFPAPGPNSTLGELDSLGRRLDAAITQVRGAKSRLEKLAGWVRRGRELEAALEHGRRVSAYLESTVRGLAEIREAVRTADAKRITGTVESVARRLEREAESVNGATERLMQEGGPLGCPKLGAAIRPLPAAAQC